MMRNRIGIRLLFLIGFLCCCLPLFLHLHNEKEQQKAVATYQKKLQREKDTTEETKKKAEEYNSLLFQTQGIQVEGSDKEKLNEASYGKLLNPTGTGIMGSLDIPKIGIELPIYHGTSTEVLEHGIGHLAASSFPVGGKSNHAVLTGHTGLNSAKLFTDLTEMKKGDLFFIHVLDQKLAYKVDQIEVVKSEDTRKLQIIDGEDHVTLLTCTPYGVNDHRLLVRGVRTAYHEKEEHAKARDHHSQWMEVYKRAILAGLLIIFVLIAARKGYEKIRGRRQR